MKKISTLFLAFALGAIVGIWIAGPIARTRLLKEIENGGRKNPSRSESKPLEVGAISSGKTSSVVLQHTGEKYGTADFSVPLSRQYDRLKYAAEHGDMHAICKLIKSFDYCVNESKHIRDVEDMMDRAASSAGEGGNSDGVLSQIYEIQSKADKAVWFCSDLPVDNDSELMRWIHQAAERGDVAAMVRFSIDPPIGEITLNNVDAAYLFKKESPKILEKAVRHGDISAIRSMFQAQVSGFIGSGYGVVPIDRNPVMLIATAEVLMAYGDDLIKADVDAYLRSAPHDVAKARSSAAAHQLKEVIEEAVIASNSGSLADGSKPYIKSRSLCD